MGFTRSERVSWIPLLVIIPMIIILMAEVGTTRADLTAAECKVQRRLGINACKSVLAGMQPSSECCYRVRVTPVECVCPVVTPALAALVKDINKAIRMIESCGRRVPRHFKCGSITTP